MLLLGNKRLGIEAELVAAEFAVARDQRALFQLDQLIQGWQEGLQLMSRGDTVRFWIPGHLAYDMQPPSPGTPRGMLVFDVTLYDFTEPTAP